MVIWLIGLAGAGKTTIGREVYARLKTRKPNVVFLDGDHLRAIMGHDLGYTLEDRRVNAWRICRLCQYLDSMGIDVVCAILAMFQETLDWNRDNYSRYFEVYIDVPMEVLSERDQKGLYSGVLAGRIGDVAGVDLPFNPPTSPDWIVDNGQPNVSPAIHADRIVTAIEARSL